MNRLTQQELKQALFYNSSTGYFSWRISPSDKCHCGMIAGTINHLGRRMIGYKGSLYQASQLAWLYMTGEWPDLLIDHKDHNKSNDQWENLRLATVQQNGFNRGKQKNNTSGYKGVSYLKGRKRWEAKIMVSGKTFHLGKYLTAVEAARAYQQAALALHGEFASF